MTTGTTDRGTAGPDGARPDDEGPGPDTPVEGGAPRRRRARRAAGLALTVLALVFVDLVLVAPHDGRTLSARWWARLPLEGVAAAVVLLALPPRPRRLLARLLGAVVGVLAALALLDVGFLLSLNRSFDVVLDWSLLGNAADYLRATGGGVAVVAGWTGLAVAALALLAAGVGAAGRVAGLLGRHRRRSEAVVALLAVGWLAASLLGVEASPNTPAATGGSGGNLALRVSRIDSTLGDLDAYRTLLAQDPWRDVPPSDLLTGLRGKDVLLAVVESYGRVAVDDPEIGPGVRTVLDDGTSRLGALGFHARSGWLTSTTFGGASWLAHSSLLSGTAVHSPQRYRLLLASDRLTLPRLFGEAGWRTVAAVPSVDGAWPESSFYGYDRELQTPAFGYRGPHFGWSPMPDQYVLDVFHREELAKAGRPPVFAELALTSSHAPWAPLPRMTDWSALGDGSVFDPMPAQGKLQSEVWPEPASVKREYGHSVEYTLTALVQYLERYGTDDTVLVFVGDHQPMPLVSGVGATHEVPMTVVAKDPKVLDALSGWGWTEGLRPADDAPVTGMWEFRDRFLAAYSPRARP